MTSTYLKHFCKHLHVIAAIAVLASAGATAVAAQYQWRDSQGRMVFSDLPPPASVAPARIIRAPETTRSATPARSAEPTMQSPAQSSGEGLAKGPAGAAAMASIKTPVKAPAPGVIEAQSTADREMAYRKRLADRAEEEKKALEASHRKLELARACSDAQGDIRSLESGQRISRINAAGEREFLSQAQRSERLKTARKSVGETC